MAWTINLGIDPNTNNLICAVNHNTGDNLKVGSIVRISDPLNEQNSELLKGVTLTGNTDPTDDFDPVNDFLLVVLLDYDPTITANQSVVVDLKTQPCSVGADCKHAYVVIYKNKRSDRGAKVKDRSSSRVKDTMGGGSEITE